MRQIFCISTLPPSCGLTGNEKAFSNGCPSFCVVLLLKLAG
jgi:hypothetical protein